MGDKPDFSGWATKAGLVCSDGRVIMKNAFSHNDKTTVPLVWEHRRESPENILGHAVLESREGSVYAYGFFNDTNRGEDAKKMVLHGDITKLSIRANHLKQNGNAVVHGDINELSLVIAGANPGADIENVYFEHSDTGLVEEDETEAIIRTGETIDLVHSDDLSEEESMEDDASEEVVEHADKSDPSVGDVLDSMSDIQRGVTIALIDEAYKAGAGKDDQSDDSEDKGGKKTANDTEGNSVEHSDNQEGTDEMTHNLFEKNGNKGKELTHTLTPEQIGEIFRDAEHGGSLKESVLEHAASYGIENIEVLFPDAKAVANSPELIARRMEWVPQVVNGAKHSPFSRIKSTAADVTADEARARGYVKGNLKKDEIIKLLKRVTSPTTVYKKQKLDRDDIVDITDLDVVAFIRAEMRMMLDEELGRAILIGDGREADDPDKIDDAHLRPIAYDDDMYAHKITMQSNAGPQDIVEGILRGRSFYKGSGQPVMFTTDDVLTDLILQKDKVGRRLYETEAALAAAMRVSKIVPVEVLEAAPEILAILVNMADYTLGADKGGEINTFDDFDIDYNQYKYLMETRVSGALTKPKSAIVVRRDPGTMVTPTSPSFDGASNTITFPNTPGVIYKVDGHTVGGSLVIDGTTEVEAYAATGYSFPANVTTNWTFVYSEG